MIDDSIESLEIRRGIYRSDRSISCAGVRLLHTYERQPGSTTAANVSGYKRSSPVAAWLSNCTWLGLVRTSYIRVGENPEVRPPSKSGAWVVDSGGFRRLVDMEIQKAQRLRYCVSIVCIAADRRGPEEEEPAVAVLAERVTPLIRSTDVVTCWDPPCLALMLIDADVASLPSIVDRLTTRRKAGDV